MNYEELLRPIMRIIDIQRFLGKNYRAAKKVFDAAKSKDNDPYHLRPADVPTHLVLDVMNLNRSFVLKQLELKKKEEETFD